MSFTFILTIFIFSTFIFHLILPLFYSQSTSRLLCLIDLLLHKIINKQFSHYQMIFHLALKYQKYNPLLVIQGYIEL
jgi:hypothetical protein